MSEGLVVLVGDLRFKSGSRIEFLRLCSSETCQCAKHCANDFGDFGVLHGVHQCVLDTSRVALRLGRCVLLTEGCDQRVILQHLMSTLLLLLTGVAGAASSDCSIEGVLLSSSSDDALSGGGLLNCCAADCLGVCSAATMTCANGHTAVLAGWLVGWCLGRGPELLLRYHVRVARVLVVWWAHVLHRPPTAS